MAITQDNLPKFLGFGVPEQNWFKMPNEWTDLTANMTLAEIKVVEYILKHTWGYQEYGVKKRITTDEFVNGRKRKDGTRIDRGTNLDEKSVRAGLRKAVEDGFIIEEVDDSDKGRVKKYFSIKMRSGVIIEKLDDQENEGGSSSRQGGKFSPPDLQNFPTVQRKTLIERNLNKQQAPRSSRDKNNNSGGGKQDVVVALTRLGITEKVAQRLASRHKEAAINQQIDYHEYELETDPQKIKSPSGRLRTRIEDNWAAPDGYAPNWREQRTAAKQQQEARQEALEVSQREREEETQRRQEATLRKRLAALQTYQPSPELTQAWDGIVTQIEARSHDLNSKLLAECLLVQVDGTTATIWTPNKFIAQQLEQHLGLAIRKQLARHLKANLSDIRAVFVTSNDDEDPPQ